jgi:hypothetical protein
MRARYNLDRMTALVPAQRCENCHTALIPYGAQMCWACGGPAVRVEPGRTSRTVEAIALGGGIGGSLAYWLYDADLATLIGAAIGAAVFALGAGVHKLVTRRPALPHGQPMLALAASTYRTQLDAVERDVVAFLITVDHGLRANADAVAARGGSSPPLDHARHTLEDVRVRYEAHLGDTLVASELATVATWLRRMSELVSLPVTDAEQARAVLARFDQDLAAARSPAYTKRAQLAPGATPALVLLVRGPIRRSRCAPSSRRRCRRASPSRGRARSTRRRRCARRSSISSSSSRCAPRPTSPVAST